MLVVCAPSSLFEVGRTVIFLLLYFSYVRCGTPNAFLSWTARESAYCLSFRLAFSLCISVFIVNKLCISSLEYFSTQQASCLVMSYLQIYSLDYSLIYILGVLSLNFYSPSFLRFYNFVMIILWCFIWNHKVSFNRFFMFYIFLILSYLGMTNPWFCASSHSSWSCWLFPSMQLPFLFGLSS